MISAAINTVPDEEEFNFSEADRRTLFDPFITVSFVVQTINEMCLVKGRQKHAGKVLHFRNLRFIICRRGEQLLVGGF